MKNRKVDSPSFRKQKCNMIKNQKVEASSFRKQKCNIIKTRKAESLTFKNSIKESDSGSDKESKSGIAFCLKTEK